MSFATIMVHVDDAAAARIRLAGSLAERFNSVLIGIAATAPIPPPAESGDIAVGEVAADALQETAAILERRGNEFRSVLAGSKARSEWRSYADLLPHLVLAREARAADLVIIGGPQHAATPYDSLDRAAVILLAGRPVLVVPPALETLTARRVVMGWKDTREARRAALDALPFLHEAEMVMIVQVSDPGREDEAQRHVDDVARHLGRHRITTTARVMPHVATPAHELVRVATAEGADLIVLGGYGHSRLGEWIFGGVTRDLLTTSPVCCLFSH
jgi:nucleotide-binding universal stress UspA family protein